MVCVVLCFFCFTGRCIIVSVDDSAALKENLSDEVEYSLLPKPAWDKLVSWYGLQQGQVCITESTESNRRSQTSIENYAATWTIEHIQ